jgi:hypothetical protein
MMSKTIEQKMELWKNKADNISMFKFASMLYITAPDNAEGKLDKIINMANSIATNLNDIEIARAKKEIEQILEVNND